MGAGLGSLNHDLQELHHAFETLIVDGRGLLGGLSDAQYAWQPDARSWSIGQIFAHLHETNAAYLAALDAAIAGGRARGLTGSPPFDYGLFGNFFISALEPPPRLRFKAPGAFKPVEVPTRKAARETYTQDQRRYQQRVLDSAGLHLVKVRVRSPALALLRIGLGQTFQLMAAHERRHLWQANQRRGDENFPAA